MTIRPILVIPIIIAGAFIILLSLVRSANRPNDRPNGFDRTWEKKKLIPLHKKLHEVPLTRICGSTEEYIYFNTPDPRWIIRLDTALKKLDSIAFGLSYSKETTGLSLTIVEPPSVYFFLNNYPAIFRGQWDIRVFDTLYKPSRSFTRAIRVPPDHIVLRILDSSQQKQLFQKINIRTGNIEISSPFFQEQEMGGFDKDGYLVYNAASNNIFFIEQFRNNFYCMDTLLNLVYSANTIDTFHINHVPMEWVDFNGTEKLMPAKSRTLVNVEAMINEDVLYIRSKLKADNESMTSFKQNAVIDMYNTGDGKYKGSFYIPVLNEEPLLGFTVKKDLVFGLFQNHVSIFRLQ